MDNRKKRRRVDPAAVDLLREQLDSKDAIISKLEKTIRKMERKMARRVRKAAAKEREAEAAARAAREERSALKQQLDSYQYPASLLEWWCPLCQGPSASTSAILGDPGEFYRALCQKLRTSGSAAEPNCI